MKKLFGKRLRELRISKGFTQEKTAELIGIKPENYSRIENGISFPKPENIEKLSRILKVNIADLFEFEHLENPETLIGIIIEKLRDDKDAAVMTYKFLKSINKI